MPFVLMGVYENLVDGVAWGEPLLSCQKTEIMVTSIYFYLHGKSFHHFQDEDVVRLLADFGRIAKHAVIVNDLIRNLVPYYFTRVAGPILR